MKASIIVVSAILIILGILVLASVSAPLSLKKFDNTFHFLLHQILFGLLPGIFLGFLAFKIPLKTLKKAAPYLLLITVVFAVLVFVPIIGISSSGAARWVSLGPISFQPSEFLKLGIILYLATWLSSKTKENKSKIFIPFLAIVGLVSLILIRQSDISTLGIIIGLSALMYFLSETPLKHIFFIILTGVTGLIALAKIAPYRWNRLLVFLEPEIEPMGIGYQINQSLIACGSGGIMGLGLGMSVQQFGFLPEAMGDSIFAIFAEETGFIGSAVLVILFLVFAWQGFKIAKNAQDRFSFLAASGISAWITLQALVNIGAMIGILPLTGIPLPFISYGGSHLVAELIGVGILLNISKET